MTLRPSRSAFLGRSRWRSAGGGSSSTLERRSRSWRWWRPRAGPLHRDELAAMFWPEADDEAARSALRRTLSVLRTAVGESGLIIERTRVAIDPATSRGSRRVRAARASSSASHDLDAAVRPWPEVPSWPGLRFATARPLTSGRPSGAPRSSGWSAALLERLAGTRLGAGDRRRRRRGWQGSESSSTRSTRSGQRLLIELLARAGDRSGAIRQYRELVALYDRELGRLPAPRDDRPLRRHPGGQSRRTNASLITRAEPAPDRPR